MGDIQTLHILAYIAWQGVVIFYQQSYTKVGYLGGSRCCLVDPKMAANQMMLKIYNPSS